MASFWLDPATNKRYSAGRAFSYDGINYTRQGANVSTFSQLGFTPVYVGARPSDRFYIVSGPLNDGSYSATPRDLAQLKESEIGRERSVVSQMLTPTDWYYARQVELGEPGKVPAEVAAYRQEVRSVYAQRKLEIEACASVEELEALITAPANVLDEAGEMVANGDALPVYPDKYEIVSADSVADYRGFYAGLLVSGVFQTIRSQAAGDLVINMNYTDFIAALVDAKVGLGIDDAFQSCIDLLVPSLTLTQAEYDELIALYSAFGLDSKHTVPPFSA